MDAGTKADEHYQQLMAPWRFKLRQLFLVLVRPESKILARLQRKFRRPFLDSYFAITANLGAHTFYMIMLPVIFWFINFDLGLNYVLVLALGVFITGVVKDLLCLPRPASPPCHRISMSGSAKLEYGMPSTHSTNTVGVVLLVLERNPNSVLARYIAVWLLLTLILGRLYTSMHGFVDVFVGILLGFVSHYMRLLIVANFNPLSVVDNFALTLLSIASISACPQPVDNCPCFDDSVAFIGVVLGAIWTRCLFYIPTSIVYGFENKDSLLNQIQNALGGGILSKILKSSPVSQELLEPLVQKYLRKTAIVVKGKDAIFRGLLRYIVGVALIIAWRHFSKRALLKLLMPVYKLLSMAGIQNPRRHFKEVDEYADKPPTNLHLDAIPDSPAELRKLVHNMRRKVKDQVGPQSDADIYELEAQLEHHTQPETLLKRYLDDTHVEKAETHYSVEIAARLLVYAGIAPIALTLGHAVFNILHI